MSEIAPWCWPLLLALGLWPSRGRWSGRESYLHAFALVHVLTVPMFSVLFPRFYFLLVPWIMIVMGRGADRVIAAAVRAAKGRAAQAGPALSAALLILMAASAAFEVAQARPNREYLAELEARRRVAELVRAMLPSGCRFMAELENHSIWYLAGLGPTTQEITPANSLDQVIEFAAVKRVKYIIFHKSPSFERYEQLLPLLEPGFTSPFLKLTYSTPASGGDTYVIYEVLPVSCGTAARPAETK